MPHSSPADAGQPVDPDLGTRGDPATTLVATIAAIAAGGVIGSLARWGVAGLLPTPRGSWPWSTFCVNVVGSLALGVLMARLLGRPGSARRHPYLQPFLGVGVLGGFTTFSTFATDGRALVATGHPGVAGAYLLGSVLVCLAGTVVGLRVGAAAVVTDALLVALGAAVGAPLRWLTDRAVTAAFPSRFPWGTLCVNLLGSFVLGVVLGASTSAQSPVALLVGTGFCGAFTTFSTFSFESVRLLEARPRRYAAWNLVVSVTAGCLLAAAGWALGAALGGGGSGPA